jgi:acetyl esterase/lipase
MRRSSSLTAACLLVLTTAVAVSAAEPPKPRRRGLFESLAAYRDMIQKVAVTRDVEYGEGDGVKLKLDVVQPKADSDSPRPALVFIHGGGWKGGNKRGGIGRLTPFVARGDYVGFSVGYRLSGVAKWPAQIHDCKAAIRWIRLNADKYNVDPDKIGVWGVSAGGHLVSMLGTSGGVESLEGHGGWPEMSSRVTCVVNFCGPSDFLAFGVDSPRMNKPGGPVYDLFGGPLKEKVEAAQEASPVTHASQDDAPLLIMHGTKDGVVPIDQARRLHQALSDAGADSTLVTIEGGGHIFGGYKVTERVTYFFARHLLGKPVEVSAQPIGGSQ